MDLKIGDFPWQNVSLPEGIFCDDSWKKCCPIGILVLLLMDAKSSWLSTTFMMLFDCHDTHLYDSSTPPVDLANILWSRRRWDTHPHPKSGTQFWRLISSQQKNAGGALASSNVTRNPYGFVWTQGIPKSHGFNHNFPCYGRMRILPYFPYVSP